MPSQTALQSGTKTQLARAENGSELIVETEKLFDRMNELYRRIESRAYEFFEERGYEIGHDTEDWFRAESEFLLQIPVEIRESDTTIMALAEMPGFDEKEITVNLKTHHLLITARMEGSAEDKSDEPVSREQNSKVVFYSFTLPCAVEADRAKAIFKDGLLEISMPKRVADEAKAVEGKIE
jgi:HSP20 family molecular chaperone IbpA